MAEGERRGVRVAPRASWRLVRWRFEDAMRQRMHTWVPHRWRGGTATERVADLHRATTRLVEAFVEGDELALVYALNAGGDPLTVVDGEAGPMGAWTPVGRALNAGPGWAARRLAEATPDSPGEAVLTQLLPLAARRARDRRTAAEDRAALERRVLCWFGALKGREAMYHRLLKWASVSLIEAVADAYGPLEHLAPHHPYPLLPALENQRPDVFAFLVARAPVNLKVGERVALGPGLLDAVVARGDADATRRVLERGVRPSDPDGRGRRPLHTAVRLGRPDLVALLLEAGADVHQVDGDGDGVLHVLARSLSPGSEDAQAVGALLVRAGADGAQVNALGEHPDDVARARGNPPLAAWLAGVEARRLDDALPEALGREGRRRL